MVNGVSVIVKMKRVIACYAVIIKKSFLCARTTHSSQHNNMINWWLDVFIVTFAACFWLLQNYYMYFIMYVI